jgi:myo-inositol-1(or 4)-monophosphatase
LEPENQDFAVTPIPVIVRRDFGWQIRRIELNRQFVRRRDVLFHVDFVLRICTAMVTHQDRLNFALQMASDASALILRYYQTGDLAVESKADESPVTIADRGAEQLMRRMLGERFPEDGVLGEEFDDLPSRNGYRWILDPIDGTKAFIHGVPLFGTLIGVEHQGRMVAGVCAFPALQEVVYAAEGGGCWWKIGGQEPRRTFASTQSDLSKARLMVTEPSAWKKCGRSVVLNQLMDQIRLARGWGDCYGHALVATGRAEIAADPMMSAWDIAALIPILRESGGYCVDWKGQETITGGDGVSVVPALREQVLAILSTAPALPKK